LDASILITFFSYRCPAPRQMRTGLKVCVQTRQLEDG
jgi:hypothetical protein